MFRKFFGFLGNQNQNNNNDEDGNNNHSDFNINDLGPISIDKLEKLKKYIIQDDFHDFDEFIKYYSLNSTHSQCAVSWNSTTIAVRCKQCQMASNSCVCVKCYLEGPHKHHSCIIHLTSSGNCDCGDPSGWKPEGYCKRHRIHKNKDENDDDNYFVPDYQTRDHINPETNTNHSSLKPEFKKRLLDAFKVVKTDIETMIENNNFRFFEACFQFFLCFTKLGDEIRSCVSESINDVNFLRNIALNSQNLNRNKMNDFFCLSGALCSDYQFSVPYTEAISQTIPELLDCFKQNSVLPFINENEIPLCGISAVLHFDFQYFSNNSIKTLVSQNKLDWIGLILKINNTICDFILNEYDINSLTNFEPIFTFVYSYHYITRVVFDLESEKPNMKKFIIEFCKSTEKFEGYVPNFNIRTQIYDVFEYILNMSKFPHKLMKHIPYFVPEVVDIFVYYLLRPPKNIESRKNYKGYSQAIMLHQIFAKHLLLFNKKNELAEDNSKESISTINPFQKGKEDENIDFNICYNGKDPKETFDFYCKLNLLRRGLIVHADFEKDNENIRNLINDCYLKAIDLPLTIITTHYLINSNIHTFKLPGRCMECVDRFHSHCAFEVEILPTLVSLVQIFLSFTEKERKSEMLKLIATRFGAIDCTDYDASTKKTRDFLFILFISTLILDRNGINSDKKNICLTNLMTEMKYRNVLPSNIQKLVQPCTMADPKFKQKYEAMNIEKDWNILVPYYFNIGNLYNVVLPSVIEKTEEMILPFPEFVVPETSNDNEFCPDLLLKNLPEVFENKYLFGVIYFFIYEYNSDIIITQYALNLFIIFAENSKSEEENLNPEDIQPIEARNLDDFVSKIKTNNFRVFAKTNVQYKGNQGISLVKLVNDLGVLGLSALRRTGLSIETVKKSKKKILRLKNGICKILRKNSQRFEETIDRRNHDCCSICHKTVSNLSNSLNAIEQQFENETLFIPVEIFNSASTDLVDKFIHNIKSGSYAQKKMIKRNMKLKYVHKKCFQQIANYEFHNYILMPKIDHIPFESILNTNHQKIINQIENSEKGVQNSIQISSDSNNRFNININFNANNIFINGQNIQNPQNIFNNPLNINLNRNNNNNANNINDLPNQLINLSKDVFKNLKQNTGFSGNYSSQSLLMKSIKDFIYASNFNRCALEILSQMILTLDYRSRISPEVLDNQSLSAFYLNLFKIATYLFYFNETDINISSNASQIEKVIYDCLRVKTSDTKNLEKVQSEYIAFKEQNEEEFGKQSFDQFLFSNIVQSHLELETSGDLSENLSEPTHEYIRRCYLIEKFYLCDKSDINDSLIDWDSYLNVHYLYHHFFCKKLPNSENNESLDLPVYRGLDLPHNFLELIYPPFNISFESLSSPKMLCLFSGKIMRGYYYDRSSHLPFTVYLTISGSGITGINLHSHGGQDKRIKSIYVDQNGDEDPGFTRGECLLLSRERYNKLIDDFLTGNILY